MTIRTSWPARSRDLERPETTSPSPPVLANGVSSAATWQILRGISVSSDDRPRRDDGVLVNDDDAVADRVLIAVGVLHVVGVDQPAVIADAGVEVDDRVAQVAVAADAEGELAAVRQRLRLPVVGPHDDRAFDLGAGAHDGA